MIWNPNADLDEATLKHMKAPVGLLLENMSMDDDMHLMLHVIVVAANTLLIDWSELLCWVFIIWLKFITIRKEFWTKTRKEYS